MNDEREKAVLHLLFLSGFVTLALEYGHINYEEAALHNMSIAEDVVLVCDAQLSLNDVRQEGLNI